MLAIAGCQGCNALGWCADHLLGAGRLGLLPLSMHCHRSRGQQMATRSRVYLRLSPQRSRQLTTRPGWNAAIPGPVRRMVRQCRASASKNLHDNLHDSLVAQRTGLGRAGRLVQRRALLAHASVQGVPVQEPGDRVRVLADNALPAVVVLVLPPPCARMQTKYVMPGIQNMQDVSCRECNGANDCAVWTQGKRIRHRALIRSYVLLSSGHWRAGGVFMQLQDERDWCSMYAYRRSSYPRSASAAPSLTWAAPGPPSPRG